MIYKFIKRFGDMVLSFVGIVLLFPLFVLLGIIIKIDCKGPIFFTQKRIGKNKKHFKIYKFRTMKIGTANNIPTHLLKNPEERITKFGKFLRKSSLDEIPQIINIFFGNMSIIGPRPALYNQKDLILERDKYNVNSIRPGLTGYAQINGRDELSIEEKAKLDGYYVKNISLWLDIKVFVLTIFSVFRSKGILEGGTGKINRDSFDSKNKK